MTDGSNYNQLYLSVFPLCAHLGHAIISVLDPIPSKGWTMEQVDEFCELVRSAMMDEYAKLDKELHAMEQDPDWATTKRPKRIVK